MKFAPRWPSRGVKGKAIFICCDQCADRLKSSEMRKVLVCPHIHNFTDSYSSQEEPGYLDRFLAYLGCVTTEEEEEYPVSAKVLTEEKAGFGVNRRKNCFPKKSFLTTDIFIIVIKALLFQYCKAKKNVHTRYIYILLLSNTVWYMKDLTHKSSESSMKSHKRKTNRNTRRNTGMNTGRKTDRKTGRKTSKKTSRNTGRNTSKKTSRKTSRKTRKKTAKKKGWFT